VAIASIGTQITEAFAGLDRIREVLDMSTEDEETRSARSRAARRRRGLRHVWFEYNEASRC
jgi:subfamily B ATP-binding cassette protein MsbA